MNTITTVIHHYAFDVSKRDQGEAYVKMSAKLQHTKGRGQWHHALGNLKWSGHHVRSEEIELETKHLFQNQWNSDKGRVFDWYESIMTENRCLKIGHFLDITQEIIDIRKDRHVCGYTGMQMSKKEAEAIGFFNTSQRALGSSYLKEDELYMLRLVPVCDEWDRRNPLTAEEKAILHPIYIKHQTERIDAENLKDIEDKMQECAGKVARAEMERDGFVWMIDRKIPTKNCIFYNHTRTFSFGWREPFCKEAAEVLNSKMDGFPFTYEIKTK